MEKHQIVPKEIFLPFALLTSLFFAWALPNNLTDTILSAFKRIMSLTDSKTAWIQVSCYLFGYGCFAMPAALYIKKFTYKSGVMVGLGLYALGTFLFYPAMLFAGISISFLMFLFTILILFSGLSFLETSTNSYVCAIGSQETATQRLNFAQSFNSFGAITGVREDTKIGGAGMVMAIAGATVLIQIQGIVSDQAGSIEPAYWVPAIAFMVVVYYSAFVSHKHIPNIL